jgi:hypothetical protein
MVGQQQFEEDNSSPIIEIARREGLIIDVNPLSNNDGAI